MKKSNYSKFAVMMLVSFVVMYLVMFLNIFQLSHARLSLTRTYMTLLMVAPMAVSMLLFMWKMYENKKLNFLIIGASILVFSASLFGLRKQKMVNDVQWMKAMIPHHSSAILTSTYADFRDPEVQKLADEIIKAQKKEIAEMNRLIKKLENKK
ncbi:MAG: DUF305 domain-containing protein [Fluviicola sp.]